jgi:hypothetical protein
MPAPWANNIAPAMALISRTALIPQLRVAKLAYRGLPLNRHALPFAVWPMRLDHRLEVFLDGAPLPWFPISPIAADGPCSDRELFHWRISWATSWRAQQVSSPRSLWHG